MDQLKKNIDIVTQKAQGLEKRLCETEETLPPEKVVALTKELFETVNAVNFLLQIKAARDAKEPGRIVQANGKLSKL